MKPAKRKKSGPPITVGQPWEALGVSKATYYRNLKRVPKPEKPKLTDAERLAKVRASEKAWRLANPEKEKARKAAWRQRDREHDKARKRAWAKANPEKVKAGIAAWQKANPEKLKAYNKAASRKANPEKMRTYGKAWYARKKVAAKSVEDGGAR